MKDYYFEKMTEAQMAVDLAKIGCEAKIIRIAGELSKADISAVGAIVEELNLLKTVYDSLVEEVENYRKRYQEAVDKESKHDEEN
jgi:hypothetical protein